MRNISVCLALVSSLMFRVSQPLLVDICKAYGMKQDTAQHFTAEIITECTLFNIDPETIFFLAIAETGLKNIYGDNGDAVGYFQLHKEAVWFVKERYQLKNVPKNHKDLINNVDLQIQIAVRYFHYLLAKYGSKEAALKHWNGSDGFVKYYNEVASYINRLFKKD